MNGLANERSDFNMTSSHWLLVRSSFGLKYADVSKNQSLYKEPYWKWRKKSAVSYKFIVH